MATTCRKKVMHLVVDSGALIKNAPLHEIGGDVIYTVEEVVAEIKDKATKQRLQFLPYELKFREPPLEIIKLVTDFSKKTGDYSSLSATDIRLLALTFLLEKENVGTDHLNTENSTNQAVKSSSNTGTMPLGFYIPHDEECVEKSSSTDADIEEKSDNQCSTENTLKHNSSLESPSDDSGLECEASSSDKLNSNDTEDHDSDNYVDDDNEGWITPNNIEDVNEEMKSMELSDRPIPVACITTDFAMQNVLLQMGLKLVSVEGMQIRRTRTYILRCHACFKTTSIMTKKFCSNCGNQTLKRVSVCVNDDGTKSVHINFKRPIKIRGTRHSLPMPKGGKHADNPILCEDQPLPQNRPSHMALKKVDVFDPNFIAEGSPFAAQDIYSRAAHLGIRNMPNHYSRKNPNENRKCSKKRR